MLRACAIFAEFCGDSSGTIPKAWVVKLSQVTMLELPRTPNVHNRFAAPWALRLSFLQSSVVSIASKGFGLGEAVAKAHRMFEMLCPAHSPP